MDRVVEVTLNGLLTACFLALPAIGLSIVFRVARFANVAHGDLLTIGAYAAYFANVVIGMPVVPSTLVGVALGVAIGGGASYVVFHKLRIRSSFQLLLASIGLSIILRHVVQLFWGPGFLHFALLPERPYTWGVIRVTTVQLVTMLVVATTVAMTHWFLAMTPWGRLMRAVGDSPELAAVSGIDLSRVHRWMWVLVSAMASLAGILYGLNVVLKPTMGWELIISIFAAAILGGIGSPYGALGGAAAIALAQEWSTLLLPSVYKETVGFLAMIGALLVRQGGLWKHT